MGKSNSLLPIYTSDSCRRVAYQLNWSFSLFWRDPPVAAERWLEPLREVLEREDCIRILQHRPRRSGASQFLLSTRPDLAPRGVLQKVKGRLQYLLPNTRPFRRNYSMLSVGSTRGQKVDRYLAKQIEHHWSASPEIMSRLQRFQYYDRFVDLSQVRTSNYGRYQYNLQIVLEAHPEAGPFRWERLPQMRDRLVLAAQAKGHLLSRAALLTKHLHLGVGCHLDESPESVALSYMNNLAHACGMDPLFRHGFYIGTFGNYDLGAVYQR